MRQWVVNGRRVNRLIKRIQSGTVATTTATGTTSILAVDRDNAVLLYCGHSTTEAGGGDPSGDAGYVDFQDASTVRATQGANTSGGHVTISFMVVEFFQGVVKRIQYGTCTGTTAITTVDLNAAWLFWDGFDSTFTGSSSGVGVYPRLSLAATAVTNGGAAGSFVAAFAVVEFN